MDIRLNDDLTGKFEFVYKEGKPFLRVLDVSIKRVAAVTATNLPGLSSFPTASRRRTGST